MDYFLRPSSQPEPTQPPFRKKYALSHRKSEALRLRTEYPERVPVIIECGPDVNLKRQKYLVPHDVSVAFFFMTVRKGIKLGEQHGVYMLTEQKSPPVMTHLMGLVYNKNRNEDGFLYLTIAREEVFG